ncbi:MAG TPA: ATP-binding protein [Candidatus Binatia bacterium]|nr:ATP-binding protein [Candidatus Binatia bacterium]
MEALPQSERLPVWPGEVAQYALEQCADAALLADGNGRLLYGNQAAGALLGYRSEELLERRLEEVLPDLPRLLAEGEVCHESVCQHRDGRRLTVEVVLRRPVVEGRSLQFALLREIGERRRLEEQLREARRMEVVGRLVASVSHDFNNLLTAILIYTGLLLHQLPPESPLRRQAEHVNLAAERGRALVSQLTALGVQRSCQPALLSLNEVVESMRDMLTRLLGENSSLETSYGERLASVWADRTQMERMLVNLVVNARDAMPDGGVLRIATANFTTGEDAARQYPDLWPGPYVRLTVSDTGCGMDEETRAHALDPFYTTKPRNRGSGLGLATVGEIVRQSGGRIMLRSAPGRGTRVEVFLPRAEGEAKATSQPSEQQAPAPATGTVLVVEDEELVRRSLHEILAGSGYHVLQARNAREAMLIGRGYRGAIDLMLADLVLPGMGGPELADQLRPARPDMRVLYISGYHDDVRVRRLEQAGKAFFPKPFTAAAIAEKVSEVLAAAASNPSGESPVTSVTAAAGKGY